MKKIASLLIVVVSIPAVLQDQREMDKQESKTPTEQLAFFWCMFCGKNKSVVKEVNLALHVERKHIHEKIFPKQKSKL